MKKKIENAVKNFKNRRMISLVEENDNSKMESFLKLWWNL